MEGLTEKEVICIAKLAKIGPGSAFDYLNGFIDGLMKSYELSEDEKDKEEDREHIASL